MPMRRHRTRSSRSRPARPAEERKLRTAVQEHVRRHLGPIAWSWREPTGKWFRLLVLGIAPDAGRPCWTLVTAGMAARPMPLPPEAGGGRAWTELILQLPPDRPMDELTGSDPRRNWPLRELRELARYPHRHRTWVDRGHTLADGLDPGPLFPGTEMCCWLLAFPPDLPRAFAHLDHRGRHIHFCALIGLHRDEMDFKLTEGYERLLSLFAAAGVDAVVRPDRPSLLGGYPRPERSRSGPDG